MGKPCPKTSTSISYPISATPEFFRRKLMSQKKVRWGRESDDLSFLDLLILRNWSQLPKLMHPSDDCASAQTDDHHRPPTPNVQRICHHDLFPGHVEKDSSVLKTFKGVNCLMLRSVGECTLPRPYDPSRLYHILANSHDFCVSIVLHQLH